MTTMRRFLCLVLALWGAGLPLARHAAADRGIGGTGGPAAGAGISADRGIGGTGIVGVITGFGSVMVNGLEVAYAPDTPVTIDGVADSTGTLEVGQVAAIAATDDQGWQATTIAVRHEVSGPVSAVADDPGPDNRVLTVAGQHVVIDSGTLGLRSAHPGDWVVVSGLRRPDGDIVASRIDLGVPGTVLVRGPVTQNGAGQSGANQVGPGTGEAAPGGTGGSGAGWRIGDLPVEPPAGTRFEAGESIIARGTIVGGALAVTQADPDVLHSDPDAYFGGRVHRWVIESYVSGDDGQVRLGHGLVVAPGPGFAVPAGVHRAIVDLERGPHGGFVATQLRGSGHAFMPHVAPFGAGRHGDFAGRRGRPHGFGPREFGPHGFGPHEFGPHEFGPHEFGPHEFGPRPFRRHFGFHAPRGFGRGGPMRRGFGGFRHFGHGGFPHFRGRR